MFLDHFGNGSVDLLQRAGNGVITEPAGSQLRLYVPDGVNAPINPIASATGCPVAYKGAGIVSPHKINGPWCFDLKFDQFTNGNNNVIAGLLAWKGPVEEFHNEARVYEIGYYPAENAVLAHLYNGSWSGSRLATSGQTKPNGTTVQHIYRIIINPLDRLVWLTDIGFGAGANSYVNPNSIYFAFSVNGGATWVQWFQRTLDFQVDFVGVHCRNWSSAGGVTHEALFDYFSITAYDWDAKTRAYIPSIPDSIDAPKDSDKRTLASLEDETRLMTGGGATSPNLPTIGRGAFIPGSLSDGTEERAFPVTSLEDAVHIPSPPGDLTAIVIPGALQNRDYGGEPIRGTVGVDDDVAFTENQGERYYSGLEVSSGFLLPGEGRQDTGAEDAVAFELAEADYQNDKLDSDGNELLYAEDLQAVRVIDTTIGAFGNPGTGGLYGAGKNGIYYWDDQECGPIGLIATIVGGINRRMFPLCNSSTDIDVPNTPYSLPGYDAQVIADDLVRFTCSGPASGLAFHSRHGWRFTGDFDVSVDVANWSVSGGTDGGFVMWAIRDRLNYTYVRMHGPDKRWDKDVQINGGWGYYASVATGATSGRIRITRVGAVVASYYWNGSAWVQIGGSVSAWTGPVYIQLGLSVAGSMTFSVDVSNFQINSGLWTNEADWFTETPGAHRGNQASMPDKLAVVATGSSLELIDVATNKLWMRFLEAANYALSGGDTRKVRDIAWDDGMLFLAFAVDPTASEEGGLLVIDFAHSTIRWARETASGVTGGWFADYQSAISKRNGAYGYSSDYDAWWYIKDYRVYSVATRREGGFVNVAAGSMLGIDLFRMRRFYWQLDPAATDANETYSGWRAQSTEATRMIWCGFGFDNELFYIDADTIYSRDQTNGLDGWLDVMNGGTFTAEYTKALPGNRSKDSQNKAVIYGFAPTSLFIPAHEGVYKIDWPSGSWELFYGKGGTHDILPEYTSISAIAFAYDGVTDLLLVALEGPAHSQIVAINLFTNTVYGITPPGGPGKYSIAMSS